MTEVSSSNLVTFIKTILLVLSPGASVLVLLLVEGLKECFINASIKYDVTPPSNTTAPPSSTVSTTSTSTAPNVAATAANTTPTPKLRTRSASPNARGKKSQIQTETVVVAAAVVVVAASSSSSHRIRLFISALLDLIVQLTSFMVLTHMMHLMSEEIYEMIAEEDDSIANSNLIQIVTSSMVIVAAVGALGGFAVVGVLLNKEEEESKDIIVKTVTDGTIVPSSSSQVHLESSSTTTQPKRSFRSTLKHFQRYGLVIAMTLHTVSEGVAASLVDSRSSSNTTASDATAHIDSVTTLFTPYFVTLIAHNICEGLVVAASVKASSVRGREESVGRRTATTASPSWLVSAAIQSISAHIAQPLAYGATTYFLGSTLPTSLVATTTSITFLLPWLETTLPVLVSAFALGSLLGAVMFEILPEVVSAFATARQNA